VKRTWISTLRKQWFAPVGLASPVDRPALVVAEEGACVCDEELCFLGGNVGASAASLGNSTAHVEFVHCTGQNAITYPTVHPAAREASNTGNCVRSCELLTLTRWCKSDKR
jgi:hypothetical protein